MAGGDLNVAEIMCCKSERNFVNFYSSLLGSEAAGRDEGSRSEHDADSNKSTRESVLAMWKYFVCKFYMSREPEIPRKSSALIRESRVGSRNARIFKAVRREADFASPRRHCGFTEAE